MRTTGYKMARTCHFVAVGFDSPSGDESTRRRRHGARMGVGSREAGAATTTEGEHIVKKDACFLIVIALRCRSAAGQEGTAQPSVSAFVASVGCQRLFIFTLPCQHQQ